MLERRRSFWGFPAQPEPNEIVLTEPVLLRDKAVLVDKVGSAGAQGDDPYVAIYVPDDGLYALLLNPVEGAVAAAAEYGQAHFNLEGHDYTLFSATPITGGDQPRQICVYHDPNYRPSKSNWFSIGCGGGASRFLKSLRK